MSPGSAPLCLSGLPTLPSALFVSFPSVLISLLLVVLWVSLLFVVLWVSLLFVLLWISLLFVLLWVSLLLMIRWITLLFIVLLLCPGSVLRACLDVFWSVMPWLYLSIRSLRMFWSNLFILLPVPLRFHLFIRSLRPYAWLQFPDTPALLMLPVPVPFPVPPVPLHAIVGDSLVMPIMPPPAALPVVASPVGGYLSIK